MLHANHSSVNSGSAIYAPAERPILIRVKDVRFEGSGVNRRGSSREMPVTTTVTPDEMLNLAIAAARAGEAGTRDVLDRLPAPIYTTDLEGRITYFNQACTEFAGRTPELGRDSWCVTWKLYTEDGQFLPHDECPMAVAIKRKQAVRGVGAIAERPDGSRVKFLPYPTPLLDEAGEMIGAVNMLIDVTDRKQADYLRGQALRCRRLAQSVDDPRTTNTLKLMADEYEEQALALGLMNWTDDRGPKAPDAPADQQRLS